MEALADDVYADGQVSHPRAPLLARKESTATAPLLVCAFTFRKKIR